MGLSHESSCGKQSKLCEGCQGHGIEPVLACLFLVRLFPEQCVRQEEIVPRYGASLGGSLCNTSKT
jgi:hypothetical protein